MHAVQMYSFASFKGSFTVEMKDWGENKIYDIKSKLHNCFHKNWNFSGFFHVHNEHYFLKSSAISDTRAHPPRMWNSDARFTYFRVEVNHFGFLTC